MSKMAGEAEGNLRKVFIKFYIIYILNPNFK